MVFSFSFTQLRPEASGGTYYTEAYLELASLSWWAGVMVVGLMNWKEEACDLGTAENYQHLGGGCCSADTVQLLSAVVSSGDQSGCFERN